MQPQDINEDVRPVIQLTLKEVTELLIKNHGLHEGLYDLTIEFQIGIGGVGRDAESLMPGASFGVSKIGLLPATAIGPTTVDAAEVNPIKVTSKKK